MTGSREVSRPLFGEQVAALLAVGGVEAERHVEAGEQLSQLVRAGVLGQPDDVEQLEAGLLVLGPFGQELADLAVEILFEHPRLGEVIVGLAERHGLDDRAARRVVALHQEHPLGQRVQLMCAREEADPGHLVHVVVDDEQRHGFVLGGQFAEHRQSRGGRRLAETRKSSPNRRPRSSRSARMTPASSSITNSTGRDICCRLRAGAGWRAGCSG